MNETARVLLEQLANYLNCDPTDLYFLFEPAPQGETLDAIFDMPDSARARHVRASSCLSTVGGSAQPVLMAAQ